jgi:NADH-ubiquinone oxidoreductase chain 2
LLSSFISLIVGSVLGLTQFRIKRLFAYSTINHVGFILLALSVNTAESIQAFIFYILQYTLSNLNAFMILVTIGFSFYGFVHKAGTKNINNELRDRRNSPVQLISQIKGYFSLNPFIAVSLAITLFSFAGIPPLIGFFGKQMILSAALDNGYVFMALVAILTSVVSAAYYLNLIKEVFFFNSSFTKNLTTKIKTYLVPFSNKSVEYKQIEDINANSIILSSSLSSVVSVITLLLTLFIYIPEE